MSASFLLKVGRSQVESAVAGVRFTVQLRMATKLSSPSLSEPAVKEEPDPYDAATSQYIQRVLDRSADSEQASLRDGQEPTPTPAPILSQKERRRAAQGTTRLRVISDKVRAELSECFQMMDVDSSGSIDADELLAAMALIGLKSSKAELLELINSVDVNRSGSMELPEFLELMAKHVQVAEAKASGELQFSMMIRRPVVLDTFPLVSRSFDVHTMVNNCIGPPKHPRAVNSRPQSRWRRRGRWRERWRDLRWRRRRPGRRRRRGR